MPKMSRRWRNAAIVMAILGFLAYAQYLLQPGAGGAVLLWATFSAVIWYGVVYLVFLVVYGIRKLGRKQSAPVSPDEPLAP